LLEQAERHATTLGRIGPLAAVLAERIEVATEDGDAATASATNARLQALPRDAAAVAVGMHRLLGDAIARRDPAAAQAALAHATAHGLRLDAARAAALDGHWRADAPTLDAAHDELTRLGATVRARRVALAVRDLGRPTPVSRPAAGALLTAVEAEVAAHVARGLTNRQVAARVHLSPKTVEVYLTRIYAKTGCRSRVELAVAFHTRGDGAAASLQ
jgi:DNA-binding NarL/FixJ family response regulator